MFALHLARMGTLQNCQSQNMDTRNMATRARYLITCDGWMWRRNQVATFSFASVQAHAFVFP